MYAFVLSHSWLLRLAFVSFCSWSLRCPCVIAAYLTAAMVTLNQNMWIGMRYESGFMWVDQTRVSYTNWGPYEPNGGLGVVRQGREWN